MTPEEVNSTNQEKWWQSGIGLFGQGGVIWSVGMIITQIGQHGADIARYNPSTTLTAIGSLALFGGVLYRRFWPGLKPLFWRWDK